MNEKWKFYLLSHVWLFATPWTMSHYVLCPWNSPGKNTGVGSHSLFQGIFLNQGSNPDLLHCKQTHYHLSHQGSPNKCHERKIWVFIKIKWILCLHVDYLWLSHICSYIFHVRSETQRKRVIYSRIQLLSNSTVPRTPVPTQCLSGKSPGTHCCQTE